jgi:hypothetical protein
MRVLETILDLVLFVVLVIITAPVYFAMKFIDWMKER